nr:hypothetical protein [Micromonospora sp. DSM 115978]
MRVARPYLGYFLQTATIFGVGYGVMTGRVGAGIVAGLLFGLLLTAGVVAMSISAHREFGGDLSPRASSTIDVAADPADVRLRVIEALGAMSARVVADDDSNLVTARTAMSWQSFGERIAVELRPEPLGTTVTIRSRPRPPWAYIDNGKGRRNVKFLVEALELRPDTAATPA